MWREWWVAGALLLAPAVLWAQRPILGDNLYDVAIVGQRVWAVGYHGTILCSPDGGRHWSLQRSGTARALFAVCFLDERRGWAVGKDGTIVHTVDGRRWFPQRSGTEAHLFDVQFLDRDHGWACGTGGTILRTEDGGRSWKRASLGEDLDLYGICFRDRNRGVVVGEYGAILHSEDGGRTWRKAASPVEIDPLSGASQCLFRVRLLDERGFAVGMDGALLVTEDGGRTWRRLPTPLKRHLFDLCPLGHGLLAVGLRGAALRWAGNGSCLELGAAVSLNAVELAGDLGVIVGDKGTILRSEDGGRSWQRIDLRGALR